MGRMSLHIKLFKKAFKTWHSGAMDFMSHADVC